MRLVGRDVSRGVLAGYLVPFLRRRRAPAGGVRLPAREPSRRLLLRVGGFLTAMSMISGTASVPWNLVVYTLRVTGHVLLWKEKPLLGRMFLWATGLSVVALLAGGAGIVVMHKVVMGLRVLAGGAMDAVPVHHTSVDRLSAAYLQAFGPPVYEDAEIVCSRIPPAGGGMEKGG